MTFKLSRQRPVIINIIRNKVHNHCDDLRPQTTHVDITLLPSRNGKRTSFPLRTKDLISSKANFPKRYARVDLLSFRCGSAINSQHRHFKTYNVTYLHEDCITKTKIVPKIIIVFKIISDYNLII